MDRNTGWDDPLGGIELPYDGRSIWGNGNSGGSSSGGSGGNSNGCGCGCGTGLLILAILGMLVWLVELVYMNFF